jgi:hypothetical protein
VRSSKLSWCRARWRMLRTQVTLSDGEGSSYSSSEARPIRPPPCWGSPAANPAEGGGARWATGGGVACSPDPSPLHQQASEIIILRVPWAVFGAVVFQAQWLVLVVGILLVPR